jgi:hypothetical protein
VKSLPTYSIPLPLPSALPFSLPVLGGCQIKTLEAPLFAGKAPCMYTGYIYRKDDVRSPFVKPPWPRLVPDFCSTLARVRRIIFVCQHPKNKRDPLPHTGQSEDIHHRCLKMKILQKWTFYCKCTKVKPYLTRLTKQKI